MHVSIAGTVPNTLKVGMCSRYTPAGSLKYSLAILIGKISVVIINAREIQ
jgi:hypothetical protein